MSKNNQLRHIVLGAVIVLLVLALLYSGLRILESTVLSKGSAPQEAPRKTVTYNGKEYFPRQDITVLLAVGIDEEGPVVPSQSYRNSGEADMIALVVLDQTAKTYTVLCLNRDTMAYIPVLGLGGKPAGSVVGQLALSHTYGTGMEDSAENTKNAVSAYLGGIDIDYYAAMNIDGIGLLNDLAGGVTVNITEDFSLVDPDLPMGTVTLDSKQAMTYVRSRKDVGTQLNLSRMERHKEYLQGLAAALTDQAEENDSFISKAWERLSDYMVTDCSVNALTGIANRCADYTLADILSPKGENVMGNEFYEFYADESDLQSIIFSLFYAPK